MSYRSYKCLRCNAYISYQDKKYYCCRTDQICCNQCFGKNCMRCAGLFNKLLQYIRCQQCYVSNKPAEEMLLQPICRKYFCIKCIALRVNLDHFNPALPCGHNIDREVLRNFLQGKLCMNCKRYIQQPLTSYDLINGQKCCIHCFQYERYKIQPFLCICISCRTILQKINQSVSYNDGFIICGNCVNQSQVSQKVCQKENQARKTEKKQKNKIVKIQTTFVQKGNQNKKIGQDKKNQEKPPIILRKQPSSIKIIQNDPNKNQQSKLQPKINNLKLQDTTTSSTTINDYPNPKSPKSPTPTQILNSLKTPTKSIKKLKINQALAQNSILKSPQSLSYKSQNKTILNNFPQKQQQQLQSDTILPTSRIKKHLSMDTYVEEMKLIIEKQKYNIVTCNDCEYDIQQEESFEIQNYQKKIKKYCKLCYTLLTNSQAFGFTLQQPLKNNYMDASRNLRGVSNQKYKQSYSYNNGNAFTSGNQYNYNQLQPKINFQYSTKNNQNNIPENLTKTTSYTTTKPIDYSTPKASQYSKNIDKSPQQFDHMTNSNHIKITTSARQPSKRQYKLCSVCNKNNMTTVNTAQGKFVCFSCYNSKSHIDKK